MNKVYVIIRRDYLHVFTDKHGESPTTDEICGIYATAEIAEYELHKLSILQNNDLDEDPVEYLIKVYEVL